MYISLTSALDGGEWSTSRASHFPPWVRSPRYTQNRWLGSPQPIWMFWRKEKFLSSFMFRDPHLPARSHSRYADYPSRRIFSAP